MRTVLVGAFLGLVSGAVPGPFSALVAATALRGGFWPGLWVAVVPLVSETLVLALTALLLSQLPGNVIRWMGVVGGTFVLYLAWRTWQEGRAAFAEDPAADPPRRRIVESLALALLSPTPWVFWLLVGGPLFLDAGRRGWGHAVAFLAAFLGALVAVHLAIVVAAAYGHERLPDTWRRRLTHVTSLVLLVAGAALIWQASAGNFHRFVTGTVDLEEFVRSLLGSD